MNETKQEFYPMSRTPMYPAVVQFPTRCMLFNTSDEAHAYGLIGAIRWQPWTNPPLPPKDAFEEWRSRMFKMCPGTASFDRDCFNEGMRQGIAAERARFAEGVESLKDEINKDMCAGLYRPWQEVFKDLRALARGERGESEGAK